MRFYRTFIHPLIYLGLSLFLVACGFHLRGTTSLPTVTHRIAIQPDAPYLPLQRELRELLITNGATVVSPHQKPTSILTIIEENFDTTDTSIGADGRIREQGYAYTVQYMLTDSQGKMLLNPEPDTVSSQRLVEYNPDFALAQSLEARTIKAELRWDVASKIVDRLSYAREPAASKP